MSVYRTYFLLLFMLFMVVSATIAQNSSLQASHCRFELPRDVHVDCFLLTVPENRQTPNNSTIKLAIAILRHPSNYPEPDPILFLQGGPGGATLDNLHLTFENRFKPLFASNRDIIVFDQRGIGNSRPNLDCVSYRLTEINLLDFDNEGQVFTRIGVNDYLNQILIQCGQALSNLHDLSAYNSVESAADMEAIRQAFGYDQLNLWGISYGTRLALTAMRDYPNSFRRVALDSVYPLEANLYTELPTNFDRSLQVLFSQCAEDIACNRTFPNLESVLFDTVAKLNQNPIRIDAPNPYNNQMFNGMVLDGDLLLRTIFQLLYASDVLPRLPQLIYEASEDNYEIWSVLVGWLTAQRDSIAIGMNYAVQCQEEFVFTEPHSILAAWAEFPNFASYTQTINSVEQMTAICNAFNAGTSPITENQPVSSTITTLIITGEYDPITPPRWARQVDDQLTNSIFLEFPSSGHGVSGSQGCAQSIVVDYFRLDELSHLDTSCIDDLNMIFSGSKQGDFYPPDEANSPIFGILNSR